MGQETRIRSIQTISGSTRAALWIAGEDPADCTDKDGDCNLTLVICSLIRS